MTVPFTINSLAREAATMSPIDKVAWIHDLIEAIQRSTLRNKENEGSFEALQAAQKALQTFISLMEGDNGLAVFNAGNVIASLSMLLADKGNIGNPMAEALHVYRARTGY